MQTLKQAHSRDAAYFGDRPDWIIAASIHRDSSDLEQSNFAVMEARLLAEPGVDGNQIRTERSSHWAVGWVDYLIIDPACSAAIALVEKLRGQLNDYPVLDERDFSEREMESANRVWRDCYPPSDRVRYVRRHRGQFEFRGFADMLGCLRGKYFAGYASEILH